MDEDELLDRCESCGAQPAGNFGRCWYCNEYGPGAGARAAKERHQNLMDMKEHAPRYVDLMARIVVAAQKGMSGAVYGNTYSGDHALVEIRTLLEEFVRPGYEQPGTTVDAAAVAGEEAQRSDYTVQQEQAQPQVTIEKMVNAVAQVEMPATDAPVTVDTAGIISTCKHCRKEFPARTRKFKYCSESCFAAARNESARARRAEKRSEPESARAARLERDAVSEATSTVIDAMAAAKAKSSPMHGAFDWSDTAAAAQWRSTSTVINAMAAAVVAAAPAVPATPPVPPSLAESRERAADAVALAEAEAERAPCATCEVLGCAAYREGKAAGGPECQAELKRCGVSMPQVAAMCRECEHRGVCCARGTKAGSAECEEMSGGI